MGNMKIIFLPVLAFVLTGCALTDPGLNKGSSNSSPGTGSSSSSSSSIPTGAVWTQTAATNRFPARYYATSVIYNNLMWVMGGAIADMSSVFFNDVWCSPDGSNWTKVTVVTPFTARYCATSVVYNNEMWVMGGYDSGNNYLNDVWHSPDGSNWTKAAGGTPFTARSQHTSVVFNNMMWVIGGGNSGFLNDVWSSPDGSNWTKAAGGTLFTARDYAASVVYDNKMWVMGGWNGSSINDVWYSPDGTNWTQVTGGTPFSPRHSAASVVYNNLMWIMGGANEGMGCEVLNDVWRSPDGSNWTKVTVVTPFPVRIGAASFVADNRIWVLGGGNGGVGFYNDVWWSH